ncbi:hypothetical protein BDF21DRAFT_498463 [Thamnidium elegans]|uniref:Uncharacterized protein n=1 Tax=Thamnidium elegans TaxID=101142 RepID=A0A8H7T190_9FUNG|nr:hypothetical protein INT48_002584 [Thamnidium elegans]KAI8049998.1 hypothetical protein BDF21DRAFT_498463 [Thamnidium elegans]
MGGTISKSKIFVYPKQHQSKRFSCSTSSSERTMVEPATESNNADSVNKKPSILPNNNFFGNLRDPKKKKEKKVQQYHYTANISSISRRKPKHHKKKKVVTKSIIGRPSNFKHLNNSTHMHHLKDGDDDEADKIAAQMIVLSGLIKPLPNDDKMPIIPPRSSSYGNSIYIKQFPIPATTSIATPSIKKNKKKVVGMKNSSISKSSIARKRAHRAAKKIS